jgi:site-specific DNA-methyltransferase (adenine-specific)
MVNQVIEGDCLDFMKDIPDKSINLVIVDPPYGINYAAWDNFNDFIGFTEKWVGECFRVLKDDGSFYSFMGWSNVSEFKLLLDKYGTIRNWITWARTKGRGSSKNYKSMKEEILYYTKGNRFTWNEQKLLKYHITPYTKDGKPRGWFTNEDGIKCRWTGLGNVWHYTIPFFAMKEFNAHPTQKPLLMIERIIISSSNEGDIILDPFAGSGTTGVACKNLNRNYILIEKEPEYIDIINKRLTAT